MDSLKMKEVIISLCAWLIFLSFTFFLKPLKADELKVALARFSPDDIEFDGDISDWQEAGYPSVRLSEKEVVYGKEGWEGEEDAMVKVFFAYDDGYLYLGVKGKDDKHVRTQKFEYGEDHLEIWISLPESGSVRKSVLSYFPGRKFPTARGGVRWIDTSTGKSKGVAGAKFREKYLANEGWEAELKIPWKSMPDIYRRLPETMWGVAFIDTDNYHIRTKESILATGWRGEEPELSLIELEDIKEAVDKFLETISLKSSSVTYSYSNVAMDGKEEVIVQAGTSFAVMGHGFKGGQGFVYVTLPVSGKNDIQSFDLADVTNDGRNELIFKYYQRDEKKDYSVKIMAIYGFWGEDMRRLFLQEIEVNRGNKSASSNVQILEGALKGKTVIKVSAGNVKGWTKETYEPRKESEIFPLILPWMEEKTAYYIFRDGAFERENSQAVEKILSSPVKKKASKRK